MPRHLKIPAGYMTDYFVGQVQDPQGNYKRLEAAILGNCADPLVSITDLTYDFEAGMSVPPMRNATDRMRLAFLRNLEEPDGEDLPPQARLISVQDLMVVLRVFDRNDNTYRPDASALRVVYANGMRLEVRSGHAAQHGNCDVRIQRIMSQHRHRAMPAYAQHGQTDDLILANKFSVRKVMFRMSTDGLLEEPAMRIQKKEDGMYGKFTGKEPEELEFVPEEVGNGDGDGRAAGSSGGSSAGGDTSRAEDTESSDVDVYGGGLEDELNDFPKRRASLDIVYNWTCPLPTNMTLLVNRTYTDDPVQLILENLAHTIQYSREYIL